METNKLNIAEILKDKPKGTKLYSPLCGDCWLVTADYKGDEFGENFPIVVSQDKDGGIKALKTINLTAQGTLFKNVGECMLFPSKNMCDWEKFQWKRGDVLATIDGVVAMFDGWAEDDYTRFNTTYSLEYRDDATIDFYEDNIYLTEEEFHKTTKTGKEGFIKKLENKYGGKFNLKTLEVEEQYEFKDGDMVYVETKSDYKIIAIFQRFLTGKRPVAYAELFLDESSVRINGFPKNDSFLCEWEEITKSRLATEEEKELILSKLANIGKKWNPVTKEIEDLPKKYEFKPFDKVLVRADDKKHWTPALYSPYDDENEGTKKRPLYRTIYIPSEQFWNQCIPYEGNEHLLGTTDSPSK